MSVLLDEIKQLEANDASPKKENIPMNHFTNPMLEHIKLSNFLFGEQSSTYSRNIIEHPIIVFHGLKDYLNPDLVYRAFILPQVGTYLLIIFISFTIILLFNLIFAFISSPFIHLSPVGPLIRFSGHFIYIYKFIHTNKMRHCYVCILNLHKWYIATYLTLLLRDLFMLINVELVFFLMVALYSIIDTCFI